MSMKKAAWNLAKWVVAGIGVLLVVFVLGVLILAVMFPFLNPSDVEMGAVSERELRREILSYWMSTGDFPHTLTDSRFVAAVDSHLRIRKVGFAENLYALGAEWTYRWKLVVYRYMGKDRMPEVAVVVEGM